MQVCAYNLFTTCYEQFFYPHIDFFKHTDIYFHSTKTTISNFMLEMKLKTDFIPRFIKKVKIITRHATESCYYQFLCC